MPKLQQRQRRGSNWCGLRSSTQAYEPPRVHPPKCPRGTDVSARACESAPCRLPSFECCPSAHEPTSVRSAHSTNAAGTGQGWRSASIGKSREELDTSAARSRCLHAHRAADKSASFCAHMFQNSQGQLQNSVDRLHVRLSSQRHEHPINSTQSRNTDRLANSLNCSAPRLGKSQTV